MAQTTLPLPFGRTAFGQNPALYHRVRPDYPNWVFDMLCSRCGLGPGRTTFEIGAGTGKATRRLLDLGARPLTAVEPDPRLAAYLRETIPDPDLGIVEATFEDAVVPLHGFTLGICATAFHWLDEDAALAKIADLLRPGGWWAAIWNVYGDDSRPDPFHEATKTLFDSPVSPGAPDNALPCGLDVAARTAALRRAGTFDVIDCRLDQWSLDLDADQTVELYSTYSNVAASPDSAALLTALGRIAREQFGGHVTRNMTTSLYIARRAG